MPEGSNPAVELDLDDGPGALSRALRAATPWIAVVVLFLLWELGVRAFRVPDYLLPAPSAIWTETAAIPGAVWGHTWATIKTISYGFLLAVVVSLPLAVLVTASPAVANSIYPLLVLVQSIPKVALAPVLVVALGANEMPRIVVTFLVCFFPLVISVAAGLLSVPAEYIELCRSCRASRWRELWRVRLPYAVPFIFSGLKVAITLAVVGAVVGEFVASDVGLGYLIQSSTAFFKTPLAFGAIVILAVIGIVLFQAVVTIERLFFPWSVSDDRFRG
ncbi:ABC transporter permease [Falsiroseomonas oryzae]|uniref:ABC transporter permease n=1 Tax=Falsiroseomonas oryzae TaxID=2766473 RepID=UPI0022EB4D05|nr:ABC transporter permease [Roseomonas sp. MO-31]